MSAARLTSQRRASATGPVVTSADRECSLPPIHPSFQRPPFDHMGLRAVDLGFNSRQLFERGCAVNTVPQSKIETGIHGDWVGVGVTLAGAHAPQRLDNGKDRARSDLPFPAFQRAGGPTDVAAGRKIALQPGVGLSRNPPLVLAAFARSRVRFVRTIRETT